MKIHFWRLLIPIECIYHILQWQCILGSPQIVRKGGEQNTDYSNSNKPFDNVLVALQIKNIKTTTQKGYTTFTGQVLPNRLNHQVHLVNTSSIYRIKVNIVNWPSKSLTLELHPYLIVYSDPREVDWQHPNETSSLFRGGVGAHVQFNRSCVEFGIVVKQAPSSNSLIFEVHDQTNMNEGLWFDLQWTPPADVIVTDIEVIIFTNKSIIIIVLKQ